MKAKPVEPVDGIGQRLVPAAFTLVLAILSVIPLGIPGYAQVTPNFVLMSIYYWTIYRPDHLPYLVVFLIGLLVDLLTFGPPGATPFALLIVRATVLSQRKFFVGKNFPILWWGFALATVAVTVLMWGIGGLYGGRVLDPRSYIFQAVLTAACYPGLSWLFSRVQRGLAR
ncbi:MAG TPA: rod shape-determining protein MreD [Aliidongia sp.]|nr:rod shape-determining protein MreD [Aliidongia sp.]